MPQCARAPNRIRSSRVGRWRFRLRRAPVPLPGRGTEYGAGPVPGIKHRCLPSGAYAQVAAWSLRSLRAGVAAAKRACTRTGVAAGSRVEVVTDGCPLQRRRSSRAGRRRYLPVGGAAPALRALQCRYRIVSGFRGSVGLAVRTLGERSQSAAQLLMVWHPRLLSGSRVPARAPLRHPVPSSRCRRNP